ncbi:MAG: D-cysteine desulfhydrase family protein [Myxococcales bacterium]|nr:D-cysteine desulfhydrase family protein [Myxococcales bacterium]MCB9736770.1 D-cysteine desulfhydrase family protein [Deltaproteobacteria bacterium]
MAAMNRPDRLALAARPTPLQPLPRLSAELGVELLVKRDDLTGSHLSGNKIRKLDYLLHDALARGATHVITCGGAQSNHCRATALAARPLGLVPVLVLRTPSGTAADLSSPPAGNQLLDRLAGAELRFVTPDGYRDRERVMAALAAELERDAPGARAVVIPEGGSSALGAWGYVDAAHEMAAQWGDEPADSVVVATGSGGTLAGLALGFKAAGLPTIARGVAVCDDEATFRAIVRRIGAEAHAAYGLPALDDADFDVIDGFVGRGYALSTPEELAFLRDVARGDGLVLDPVYTNKALRAVVTLLRADPTRLGRRVVFVHTGGIFGLFPDAEALAAVL